MQVKRKARRYVSTKLGTAIQNLIQPELDFLEKQQTFDRATEFISSNRGLNSLERSA